MSTRASLRASALLFAVLLTLAACGDDGGGGEGTAAGTTDPTTDGSGESTSTASTTTSAEVTTSTTAVAAPPESAPECAPTTNAVEAGTVSRSLVHDGVDRTYELSIPPTYDGSEPVPVALNFHGFGGTGEGQNATSGLVEAAGGRGYIVVAPDGGPLNIVEGAQGSDQAESEGFGGIPFWNIFGSGDVSFGGGGGIGAEAGDVGYDDVGFVTALLDSLEAELCVDTSRIYATGHSNGAGMSSALGCEIGSRLAAIGPVSGVNLTGACLGDGPVPVLAIHGDADEAATYEGNNLLGFELGNPSVPDRMVAWAELNGCDPEPAVDEETAGVVRLVWTGCDVDTELWTLTGGAHVWPHGEADEPPTAIVANEVLLDFFEAHARTDATS